MTPTPPAERRRQVLDLRIRLERVAARAFDATCRPEYPGRQSEVSVRLKFIVALVSNDDRPQARQLARLGAHVYSATSDVLHGRVRAPSLGDVLVHEWQDVVAVLEAIVDGDAVDGSTTRMAGRILPFHP